MASSSDVGSFVESQIITVFQEDSFVGLELQSDMGDVEIDQQDSVIASDYGYPAITINPMSQIGYISLSIYPIYQISLDTVTHL